MRWLLLLVAVPLAAAHGGEVEGELLPPGTFLNHIQPVDVGLAAGQERNWTLAFGGAAGGGVMHEGWYWLIRADVEGTVRVSLATDTQTLSTWHWGTGPQIEVARIPYDTFLTLRMSSVGEQNASVRFYYDQTCDCQGKVVPATEGPVWMNTNAQAGDEVRMNLTFQPVRYAATDAQPPGNLTIRVRHLVPDEFGGFVPTAERMRTWSTQAEPCHDSASWTGCVDLAFTAQQDGIQLVWVDAWHDGEPGWGTGVRPLVTIEGAAKDTPAALWLAPLALLWVARRKA